MHIRKLTALTLAVIMLAGCSEIDYSSMASDNSADTSSNGETSVPQASIVTENKTKEYKINKSNFSYVLEAEKTEGTKLISDDRKYSGEGYITVGAYKSVSFDMEVPSTQFYDIAINALSDEGGSITLIVDGDKQINSENGSYKRMNGELYGAYNIVQSDTFESHSLCPVYLTQGTHRITLQTVKNSVSLDKITVKNTEKAADKRYSQAGTWISGKDVNTDRIVLMDYLKSIYGRKTLTAQAVTPNTNTEIDAIVKNTGRFPAIRASDLRYYTASGAKLVKNNTDIQLSQEWAKNGGIVSYVWYWYTPIGKTTFYREESTFDIGAAVSDYEDLAVMNEESLAQLLEDETISEECYAVLSDMDAIAKQLSVLKDSGVTVLFRPLPASSAGLYWWEKNSKTYKWLWINLIANFVLIPPFGAMGAAAATVLAEFSVPAVQFVYLRKELPYAQYLKTTGVYCLFGLVMAGAVVLLGYVLPLHGWGKLAVQVTGGAAVYGALCLTYWKLAKRSDIFRLMRRK